MRRNFQEQSGINNPKPIIQNPTSLLAHEFFCNQNLTNELLYYIFVQLVKPKG